MKTLNDLVKDYKEKAAIAEGCGLQHDLAQQALSDAAEAWNTAEIARREAKVAMLKFIDGEEI